MSPRARTSLARERNAEAEEEDDGDGARERSCARSVSPSSRGQHDPIQTMPLLQNMLFVS